MPSFIAQWRELRRVRSRTVRTRMLPGIERIENLDSGPPWEWVSIFYRTFWMASIEQQFSLGSWGLMIVFGFCLLAAYGLITLWRQTGPRRERAEEQGSRGAEAQEPKSRFTLHASRLTPHASRA